MTAQLAMKVRSRYCNPGPIDFARYGSGELAICIFDHDGQMQVKATVSLVPYGAPDPGEFGCWIKDWSENEGIAKALERSSIIRLTGEKFKTGFVEALHAELTPEARTICQIAEAAQ